MRTYLLAILGIFLFTVGSAIAETKPRKLMDCTLYKLYNNGVFEEGLSTEEYPHLSVYRKGKIYDVSFGMAGFDSKDQKITYKASSDVSSGSARSATLMVKTKYDTYILRHRITDTENSAVLGVRENGKRRFSKIAKFVCSYVAPR